MDDILQGIDSEDAVGGDGGKEMLDALRDAFRCVHPERDFRNVDEYLQFRRLNVGAALVELPESNMILGADNVFQLCYRCRKIQHQIQRIDYRPPLPALPHSRW